MAKMILLQGADYVDARQSDCPCCIELVGVLLYVGDSRNYDTPGPNRLMQGY